MVNKVNVVNKVNEVNEVNEVNVVDKVNEVNEVNEVNVVSEVKGSVREKWKGVLAWCNKKALLIATNLTFICCVYKKKICMGATLFGMKRLYQFSPYRRNR